MNKFSGMASLVAAGLLTATFATTAIAQPTQQMLERRAAHAAQLPAAAQALRDQFASMSQAQRGQHSKPIDGCGAFSVALRALMSTFAPNAAMRFPGPTCT